MAEAPDVDSDRSLGRLARGGALNLTGSFVAAISQFVLVAVITRRTDDATAGAFFVVTAMVGLLAAVPNLGGGVGLIYFLSRHRARQRWIRVGPALRSAFLPVVAVAVVTGGLLAVLAAPVADLVGLAGVPGAVAGVRVAGVAVVGMVLLDLLSSATRGLGSLRVTVVFAQVVQPVLQLLFVTLATVLGLTAMVAAWTLPTVLAVAGCVVALVVMYREVRRRIANREGDDSASVTPPRSFWRYAAPLGVVLVLKTVVQRLDVIVLSAVRSPSEVALYVAAARYLVLGQVVNRAMNWTLQPRVAAAVAAGDRAGVRSAYRAATAWLVLISWPVSIGCVLFPGALMEILGGRAFRSGSAILVVLAASMLVAAACGNVESVIAMVGRSRLNLGLAVVATVVNVGLLALLVPGHGGLGAAYAWAGAVLVSNVLPTVVLATLERLTPFGRSVAVAMGVSVASTAVVGGIVRFALGDSLVALVVAVPLCAVAHVLLVARSRRALHLDGLRPARAGRRATRAS